MSSKTINFGRLLGIDAIVLEGMSADGIWSFCQETGLEREAVEAVMIDAYRKGDALELGRWWERIIDAHLERIAEGDNIEWVINRYGGNNG